MFTHRDDYKQHFLGSLQRVNEDNIRYYQVDDQLIYPGVTSVISFINRSKFAAWRARVDNEEANRVSKHSTTRGTNLHAVFEDYMMNKDYKA